MAPQRIVTPMLADQARIAQQQRELEQTLRYLDLQARLYQRRLPDQDHTNDAI